MNSSRRAQSLRAEGCKSRSAFRVLTCDNPSQEGKLFVALVPMRGSLVLKGASMTRRNLIAALGLIPLAACVVNLSFDMNKQFPINSTASGSISQTQTVTLSDYSAINDHKGNIKSLDLDSADVTVTTVNAGTTATKVSGTLSLRASTAPSDGSQDVLVGTLTNVPIAVGSKVTLPGTPSLDAFLLAEVQSAGTFTAIFNGTVDGAKIGRAHV